MTTDPITPELDKHEPEPVTGEVVRRAAAHSDVPLSLDEQMRMANALSRSGVLPQHLVGKPANILAIMIASRALDVPLWQGFQELFPIEGRIGQSAVLMRSLVLRAGHKFRVVEREITHATVRITRYDDPEPYFATFTIEDALQAGLCTRDTEGRVRARSKEGKPLPWEQYTKALLVARATGICAREACPEALLGFDYTTEELGERVAIDQDGRVLSRFSAEAEESAVLPVVTAAAYLAEIDEARGQDDLLRAIYEKARTEGVIEHLIDGRSLASLILAARVTDAPATGAPGDAAAPDPASDPDLPPPGHDAPEEPTVPRMMACGCAVDEVYRTGQHREECERHTPTVEPPKKGKR